MNPQPSLPPTVDTESPPCTDVTAQTVASAATAPDPILADTSHLHQTAADPTASVAEETDTAETAGHVRSAGLSGRSSPARVADAPIIPGYVIGRELGRGGMGCVYAAEDLTFEREVAIKTLLFGANADRFITEAKITAWLPHPSIPPVHALGKLADGTPWLAMKLIHGQTLAALLSQRSSPKEDQPRYVQIFEQIAQAVGFAHARGIIHRDLKPQNVMVGEFGEVQVMDWGLAKELTGPDLANLEGKSEADAAGTTAELPHTRAGTVLGTPGYMAPEQARGEQVDARADVFSLGSMLAMFLTGQPAFVGSTLHATIAKSVAADLANVHARLDACGADADLVALAKRCLMARAEERPADGRAVAAEVAAYRAAVATRLRQAETAAAEAQVRETEQRKRRKVWFALAAVLLMGVIASSLLALWALAAERSVAAERDQKEIERTKAIAAAENERVSKENAETRRQEAERSLGFARKGNEILGSVFSGLDPKIIAESGRPLQDILRENLIHAVQELEGTAIGDPLEVAAMQTTLGESLVSLGEPGLAITVFEKALSTRRAKLEYDHPDTLVTMAGLALALRDAGKLDLALPVYEETVTLRKAKLGADHPDTLVSMAGLALTLSDAGKLDLAIPLHEETLELRKAKLGANHPSTLNAMNNLAIGYHAAGKLNLALPLFEETLTLMKAVKGPDHPDTLTTMNNLAESYNAAGKLDQALPLYEKTLELRKAKLGANHPSTLNAMNNLALGYHSAGKLEQALPLYEETLKLTKAKLGADHPKTLTSMNNLAGGYNAIGRLDLALPIYEETLTLTKTKLGADHPDTLASMANLAAGYWSDAQLHKSVPLFEEVLLLLEKKLGRTHPITLMTVANLGVNYKDAGRFAEAISLLEEANRASKKYPTLRWVSDQLADAYAKAGETDKYTKLLEEQLSDARQKFPKDSAQLTGVLARFGSVLLMQRRWNEAEPLLLECLTIREKKEPDAWTTFNTMSMLGAALLGQKKYAEAEPLLVKGYEGMKLREKSIPPEALSVRLPEALDRLIELYTALEKPDEVNKWQAERAKYPAAGEK